MNSEQSTTVVADVKHEVQGTILIAYMVGRAGINVLMDYVMSHFDIWAAHDRLIYDLSEWSVESLTSDSLRHLPDSFKPLIAVRERTWAALVITPHLEELAKILVAIYETEGVPVELSYFFDRASAESWLLEVKS